jgi:hypothetical protein
MLLLTKADYGPFAPVVGFAGVIMASALAIFAAWGGRMKTWKLPSKDLPGKERNLVLLLCGVFMVVEFVLVEPPRLMWFTLAAAALAILAVVFFIQYGSIINVYGYKKSESDRNGKAVQTLILGGRKLRPEAAKKQKELGPGIDTQALLEGAGFKVDVLWSREELEWVRKRAIIYFILLLVVGTSALTVAGFATQMAVEKKAASISGAPAPGE